MTSSSYLMIMKVMKSPMGSDMGVFDAVALYVELECSVPVSRDTDDQSLSAWQNLET